MVIVFVFLARSRMGLLFVPWIQFGPLNRQSAAASLCMGEQIHLQVNQMVAHLSLAKSSADSIAALENGYLGAMLQ
jgi:hypothetical protein